MLLFGIVDLGLVLLAGYDNSGILVKDSLHHIDNIPVSAVFDDEQMHGGVQAEAVLDVRDRLLKLLTEVLQLLPGKMGSGQTQGDRLDLDPGLEDLKHVVEKNVRHVDSLLGHDLDKALHLQSADGLPDRGAAQLQLHGQLRLVEQSSRRVDTVDQPVF